MIALRIRIGETRCVVRAVRVTLVDRGGLSFSYSDADRAMRLRDDLATKPWKQVAIEIAADCNAPNLATSETIHVPPTCIMDAWDE